MIGATLRGWRDSVESSPRWTLVRLLPGVSRPLTAVVAVCVMVSALLPTAFTLAAGALIGSLPSSVGQGFDSTAGRQVVAALVALGAIFVVQQIISPIQATAADRLGRLLMGANARQIMRATLRPASVAHLEDATYLDQIAQSQDLHWIGPRAAVNALVGDTARRLQAVIALAVVAHFQWWLAILLLIAYIYNVRQFNPLRRQIVTVRMGKVRGLRRASYFVGLTLRADVAKELRVFGMADWVVDRFRSTWLGAMSALWRDRPRLWTTTLRAALPRIAAEALGLALVAQATFEGSIGLGALVVYARSIIASEGIAAVGDSDSRVEYGAAGLRPTLELEHAIATDPRLNPPGTRAADGLPKREIRFEQVSFRYPDQAGEVFSKLDLTIPAGRGLAIVGDNGAGKTTLVKLLARLYEPTGGRITVDGANLATYDPRSWQRRVATIFQDFVRYPLSAADNIGFGAVERLSDRQALTEAAARAGALGLIEQMPDGWNTILARQFTGGVDLSGGEWQRIALARALFAASAVTGLLVLDEPTAHLDVRAEAAFYDRFLELTRGLTTIVISHRFSTVRRADRIVVLHQGRVAEDGTHDELVASGGRYARMFQLQAARFSQNGEEHETAALGPDGEPHG